MKRLVCYLAFLGMLLIQLRAAAQQKDTSNLSKDTSSLTAPVRKDTGTLTVSVRKDLVSRVQAEAREEARRSVEKYRMATSTRKQEEEIEEERSTLLKANDFLRNGLDTIGLHTELQHLETWYSIAVDGVLINKGAAQTHRNLTTTYNILSELTSKAVLRKNQVDRFAKELGKFRFIIDSLNADSMLYNYPKDSIELIRYFSKYIYVSREMSHVDSSIDKAIVTSEVLQARMNAEVYKLNSSLTSVELFLKELSDKNFERELPDLWRHSAYERPFREILRFSKAKGKLTLRFYTEENIGKLIAVFFLVLLSMLFMRALKQKLQMQGTLNKDYAGQLGMKYPFVSALIMVPSLFQFIFTSPPYIISCLFALIPAIALSFVFAKFISGYWMRFWLVMTGLFALACADNLILQESLTERWLLFILALAGMVTGAAAMLGRHKVQLRERLILYFIGAHILLEAASLMCNLYGRYNLSKVFMVCGYLCVIEGIVFLWTVRLINETLAQASDVYKNPEMRSFYINFSRVGKRAPILLYLLVIVGWLIVCGRTFYAFRRLSQPVIRFFLDERVIGDYRFSIGSLLLFFGIIAVSVILSRLISLFASDRATGYSPGGRERKAGPGSWLLLVRVTIICLGLFLALAATGFPMDRLTIVVGALGVGIGLGLQTLVNNLVSGLIIAFEKPVNVGDTVDIGEVSGTMKSIGFRSSVISTTRGGDLVIPNGDLLNSHMINWTLGGDKRWVDVTVGVAYGTELGPVKQLLLKLLKADERILQYPGPAVLFLQFGDSSINVQLNFWVRNFREMAAVKSDLIEAVDGQFRERGIVIPFPQQEVYIRREEDKPPQI